LKLLLDEHLSPRLSNWGAERRGITAASVAHLGLSGATDAAIWQYAFDHDYVVVTTNARDFLHLLNVEVHPGLIVLRESGLTREEQWERLVVAIDHIQRQENPGTYMINLVIEILGLGQVLIRQIPPPSAH
jgi:predicted nuclease of predicted toxin-antitoxin system